MGRPGMCIVVAIAVCTCGSQDVRHSVTGVDRQPMIEVSVQGGRLSHVADQQQISEGPIQALKSCPQLSI